MIEGCIVAKLVFGYLKEEGFSRTCSTFQEECSYFRNGNREIDMVLLTADLKTILDDYSRPKEAGKENTSSSTAVIKSLWKELDILIGQLKYATIPVAPRSSLSSQSARTRRLNYVSRPWKNTTPTSQELACQTTSNPAVVQQQTSSVLHGKNSDKLPLPRLSSGVLSQNQLLRLHQNQVAEPQLLTSMSSVAVAPFPTFTQANTSGPVNITELSRSHHTGQIAGCNLTISTLPTISLEDQTLSASNTSDLRTENPASFNSDNQVENSAALECADKVMDYGSDASNKGGSDITQGAESGVCSGPERNKIASAVSVGELSPTYCNAAQDELHLKSPKRKCVQPKKRTVQGDAILLSVVDSPVKSVTCTSSSAIQDVEFLENPSWDMTAPQYFVDKLLNTPLLQEKLAENINKVVGSSRQQPHIEAEESSSNMMIADVTNADSIIASSESSGADIPVEDILEQMQADPAFDALFSMFGLDALGDSSFSKESPTDAVADGVITSTMPGGPMEASNSLSTAANLHSSDALGDSSFSKESPTDAVADGVITSTMPGGPMEASNSLSTASNLHSSATSIVTDALLLLAGSPQKPPQPMLCESGGVPHSENMRSLTPPIQRQTANGTSTDRCPATKPSSSLDQGMMTSLPYVRALDFSVGKDDKSTSDIDNEMGRRKGMKNKKGTKQRPLKDNSTEQIQSRHRAQAGQTNNRVPLRTINLEGSVASSSEAKFSGVVNQSSRSTETASCLADLYTTLTPCARSALSSHAGVTPPSLPSVNPATVSAGSDTNIATAPVTSPINFANRDFLARPSIRPTPSSCTVIGPRASTFIYNSACLMPSSVCTTSQVSSTTASPTVSNMQRKPAGMHLTTRPTHSPVSLTCQGSYHTISPAICTNPRMGSTPLPANVSCQGTDPNPSSVNLSHKDTNPNHSCTSLPYSLVNLCTQAYTSATSCTSAAYSHPHTACPSTVNLNSVGVNPSLLASTSAVTGHGISTDVNVGLAPLVSTSNTLTLSSSSMLETRDMFTGEQWASEMLSTNSLNASNMLHTLAVSHANSKRCSFGGAGQLSKGNVQCLTDGLPSPPPVLLPEYLQSKELWTSRKSGNICKDKSEALNVAPAGMDNACKESVVSCDVHDSSDYQKRNASKPITRDHECSGFTQTRTAARKEPSGKRQKNLSSQHKVKKCKGSRVVKKLKSKQDSIHFPKNLNVEEFLSKLCYEEK